MGNRAMPTALRVLTGNRSKRPLNTDEPKPREGIPDMPGWLKQFPIAVKEWVRETRELDYMGVLTYADAGVLAARCYAAARIQELASDIKREGSVIVKTIKYTKAGKEVVESGSTVPNPKATQLQSLLTEYRQYGSLLGLDPSSRSKLHTTKKQEKDKFEDF